MLQNKIITSCLLLLIAVGGFFGNIENGKIFGENKVQAADTKPGENNLGGVGLPPEVSSNQGMIDKWNNAIDILNMLLGALTFLVSPAIILASWLMSPDWTSGDLFGLRGKMYEIWIIVSNIIYFIYAILLIIIALGTIFGNEKFGYKAMLPRLALGIIMVPFTWWFVQWTISLATVVTASVISIPQETLMSTMNGDGNSEWYNNRIIPQKVKISSSGAGESFTEGTDCSKSTCMTAKEFFSNGGGQWAPLAIYAYGIFKFDKIDKLNTEKDAIKVIMNLVHKGIMGALFFIIFGILVLCLVFILMMRAIKLWMYAIFSPLFTIHFVLGKDMLGEKMGDFNIKEFVGLCFVPAVIGFTLSFGLIILSAIYTPGDTSGTSNAPKTKLTLFGNPANFIESTAINDKTLTTVKIGGMSWEFEGSAKNQGNTGLALGALEGAGNMFGTIIIDIIALIFIWVAFMAAKGTSKAVGKAIEPFENMGKKVGELGASLPKYTPLPIPGGSMAGMNRTLELGKTAIETRFKKKEEESIGRMFPHLLEGSIKADQKAVYNNAMGSTTNFTESKNHVGKVMQGAKYDKESNADIIAEGFKKINPTIQREWELLGRNLTEKQKEAYNALIKGDANSMKKLSDPDKQAVWRILESAGGVGGTQQNNTTGAGFASRPSGAGFVNINIQDKTAQAKVDINSDEVKNLKDIVSTLEGTKSGMKKEDFIKNLMQHMTEKAANQIADSLNKNDFFTK